MKLLIVDDEPLIRKGIRLIIENSPLSFTDILEAGSGREAVKLARKSDPEIILMDIKMPGQDGISAAKEIKTFKSSCIVVFLTAYDRFDFAREAVRCQARDYLLKPVTPESLINTLRHCLKEVQQNNYHKRKEKRISKALFSARDSVEEFLVKELVAGAFSSTDQLLSQLQILAPDDNGDPWFNKESLPNICFVLQADGAPPKKIKNRLIRTTGYPFIAEAIDHKLVLFTSIPEPGVHIVKTSTALAEKMTEILSGQNIPSGIRIGIGRVYNNPQHLRISYAEALKALDYSFKINPGNCQVTHVDSINEAKMFSRPHLLVQQAKDYIEKHFDQKISLEEVAQQVYLHPTYLSTIIKQETGYTFSDYITFIRVKKAKQLLNSHLSVKEVARKVGYPDSNYFCRVFKKVTGVTPTGYRINKLRLEATGWPL